MKETDTDFIRHLKRAYGIVDDWRDYTEEKVIEMAHKELLYIMIRVTHDNEPRVKISYKRVLGYLADWESDGMSTIYVKDDTVAPKKGAYCDMVRTVNCETPTGYLYYDKAEQSLYCMDLSESTTKHAFDIAFGIADKLKELAVADMKAKVESLSNSTALIEDLNDVE